MDTIAVCVTALAVSGLGWDAFRRHLAAAVQRVEAAENAKGDEDTRKRVKVLEEEVLRLKGKGDRAEMLGMTGARRARRAG